MITNTDPSGVIWPTCGESGSPDWKMEKKVLSKSKLITLIALTASLVLAACGSSSGASSDRPVEVQVTMTEFAFESSLTNFQVGIPYEFVVTNDGDEEHEIMVMEPMEDSPDMDMEELDELALWSIEAEDLQPGETATYTYTFTSPAETGQLEFACHVAKHYELGMHMPITVSE